ncbi:uridine kinase [Pseudohongiella spirulinae]|uniref:Uridine kinase n=1 Tax=Pseudohongiella spirulinae TaxID=1249552 RepID=A0A0S2K9H0_9GAMM|nr:uridine kinase [Pseudohongiella spirulinae]ALO44972.1 Uridine kinase [Pseudohongiella spirulinae]
MPIQGPSDTTTIIAIAGASASGKSLLASSIYQQLAPKLGSQQLAVIAEDAYYRDQSHLPMEQRVLTDYDQPSAFEHDLLVEHLAVLKSGGSVEVPQYDFRRHTRRSKALSIVSPRVVMVEGILLLSVPALRDCFDVRIFVDTPLDLCLLRRIRRDTEERGRSLHSVIEQYERTVRPAYHQHIAPARQHADLVVTEGGQNTVAIDLITTKIRQLIEC